MIPKWKPRRMIEPFLEWGRSYTTVSLSYYWYKRKVKVKFDKLYSSSIKFLFSLFFLIYNQGCCTNKREGHRRINTFNNIKQWCWRLWRWYLFNNFLHLHCKIKFTMLPFVFKISLRVEVWFTCQKIMIATKLETGSKW